MSFKYRKHSRQLHLWFSLLILLPVVIVIGSGLLLQIKKQSDWVQPPTSRGTSNIPSISFTSILAQATKVPQAQISSWQDIRRLDVRPSKGIIKVQSHNHWEIQLDANSAEILQVAYRRSDTIEAIHDGSWFFTGANLWLFLPAAILLLILWLTGAVMLLTTLKSKYRKQRYQQLR